MLCSEGFAARSRNSLLLVEWLGRRPRQTDERGTANKDSEGTRQLPIANNKQRPSLVYVPFTEACVSCAKLLRYLLVKLTLLCGFSHLLLAEGLARLSLAMYTAETDKLSAVLLGVSSFIGIYRTELVQGICVRERLRAKLASRVSWLLTS
jgi:hypothetical protein